MHSGAEIITCCQANKSSKDLPESKTNQSRASSLEAEQLKEVQKLGSATLIS